MGKIKVLGEEVTNKIAAGEIIERPASIVKELVENSIDAEASRITIILENGGKKRIQVIDDGIGMSEEDALLSLERHATSKIRQVEDIVRISSMGFRGEAIPSIASVSKFQLITKSEASETAVQVDIEFGKIKNVGQCSANRGTEITVSRLFDIIPARKKFLKSDQVELKHIVEYIHYQALAFPAVGFKLIHNGNERINYPPVREKMNRYTAVLGADFLKHGFLELNDDAGRISVSGFISGLEEKSEKISSFRYLFINGRFIKDRIIMHSINAAYEPFIKKYRIYGQGKLPPFILFLNIEPELIDVNVHPAKMEVRFRDPHLAHSYVKNSITNTLLEYQEARFSFHTGTSQNEQTQEQGESAVEIDGEDNSGDLALREQGRSDSKALPNEVRGKSFASSIDIEEKLHGSKRSKGLSQSRSILNDFYQQNIFNPESLRKDPVIPSLDRKAVLSDIQLPDEEDLVNPWQLHESYVLMQCDDGLIIIDQHAAHERIIYEKLLHRMGGVPAVSQQLLFPVVIDIPPILADTVKDLLENNAELISKIGFKLSSYSGDTVVINEIPAELSDWEGGEVFKDILCQLQDEFSETKDFRDSIAKAVSCKAAIKINNRLGRKDMLKLINDLFACRVPWYCPHGRPILIKMTLQELERKFKRI